ncbi:MAG TPA: hypothetical protein VLJ59_18175 [Mycobacteriales bacterium]|nr:hypothetical protein [Mycobacteriales bacterium]
MAPDDDPLDRGNSPVDGWPPDFDHLVVPDDARELDADARALARERRAASRRGWLRGLTRISRWHQYPLSWAIGLAAVVAAVLVAVLLAAFRPTSRATPRAQPLSSDPAHPVGSAGGLLPDLLVSRDGGGNTALRDYRPAVIVLVPAGCDCAGALRATARVADKHHVYAVAIGHDLPVLPADLAHGSVVRAVDPAGGLFTQYHVAGSRPLLLLVTDQGRLNQVLTDSPPATTLDTEVASLTG